MATQVELIQQFVTKELSLNEVVARIGSAAPSKRLERPARSLADTERDPDPSIGDSASIKLYGALMAKKISQSEYDAIYAAL